MLVSFYRFMDMKSNMWYIILCVKAEKLVNLEWLLLGWVDSTMEDFVKEIFLWNKTIHKPSHILYISFCWDIFGPNFLSTYSNSTNLPQSRLLLLLLDLDEWAGFLTSPPVKKEKKKRMWIVNAFCSVFYFLFLFIIITSWLYLACPLPLF